MSRYEVAKKSFLSQHPTGEVDKIHVSTPSLGKVREEAHKMTFAIDGVATYPGVAYRFTPESSRRIVRLDKFVAEFQEGING